MPFRPPEHSLRPPQRPALLAAAALTALLTASPVAWAQTAKLDAALALTAAKPASRSAGTAEALIPATVRFTGDPLPALRALGVRVGSVLGNIVTVDIPASRLHEVAQVPGVVYVEASKPMTARLAASVPATGATALRTGEPLAWTGATGAGVIVGIVDDGLDFKHQDFRKADGSTRLLSLWDMRANATGTPPQGFSYGAECSPAQLNAAIQGDASACAQPSTGGHGTHVGGIAAGNGQATGNGKAAFRHIGMAPMADIISANAIGGGVSASNAVLDAVAYIKQKAQALGKLVVINLSLGAYTNGPRDGTSNYETGLSNAGGPGVVLVGAAGNEGTDPIRIETSLADGASVTVGYRTPRTKDQRIEMWYPGTHEWSIKVQSPDGSCATDVVPAGTPAYSKVTSCGTVEVSNNLPSPLNDDRQVRINFPAAGGEGSVDWQVIVTSVRGAGTVNMAGGEDSTGGSFTTNVTPVTHQILTDTCTATQVICVGAYVTRQQWEGMDGTANITGHGPINDVANFSSRGPRRNCSNLDKCPPIAKPEITAPGAMIIAALSGDASDKNRSLLDGDGVHIAQNGTSMATPHVAGAIALLMQQKPTLTPAEAKNLLFKNVQRTSFTPSLPTYDASVPAPATANDAWGYGVLDIGKALAAAGTQPGITGTASGGIAQQSLSAVIVPEASFVGHNIQIFVAAVLPNGMLFVNNAGSWQPLGDPIASYQSVQATARIELPLLTGQNLTGLEGTQVLVGYGTSAAEMLGARRYAVIHTLR